MDWFKIAKNDWEIYLDPIRIQKYVEFNKITEQQYADIAGEPYVA